MPVHGPERDGRPAERVPNCLRDDYKIKTLNFQSGAGELLRALMTGWRLN